MVARGDQAALRQIFDRHGGRMFGLALAILRDRISAADALQDAFVKIWERARQFDATRQSSGAWLDAILRGSALEMARARGRETLDDRESDAVFRDPDALDELAASETGRRLQECLMQLEPRSRHAIVLAFANGLSIPQIASRQDLPIEAVTSAIDRGMIALRKGLS